MIDKDVLTVVCSSKQHAVCVPCTSLSPGVQGSACFPYWDLPVTVPLVHRPHYRRIIAALGILRSAIEGPHTHAHTGNSNINKLDNLASLTG